MKILGLPNGVNGSAYYRIFLPLSHLDRGSGHVVTLPAPGSAGNIHGTWITDQDVIVGHCVAFEGGARMWESWQDDAALVYEADDDFITEINLSWHPTLSKFNDPGVRECHMRAVQASALLTVSTPVLAERFAKLNRNVVVLPNMINADLLKLERPRRDRLTLGWQGSPTHLTDIGWASKPVAQFLRRNPQVDLHIIGADYRQVLGRPAARFTEWSVDMWEYYANIDFDIGIAPLMPNAFNEAKSHIKALEYAALGIPVVASDVPAYRDFVLHGTTGFLVRRDHEWGRYLRDLASDEAMRAEMGAKARQHAAGFTIQEHWPKWEQAYRSVI